LTATHKYGKVGAVKTTLEIPDDLFRQTKAAAALRGESLKDFVTAALRAQVETLAAEAPRDRGWRSVFGRVRPEDVEEIERIVAEELERVDPDAWR
jgi:hypothetical protein